MISKNRVHKRRLKHSSLSTFGHRKGFLNPRTELATIPRGIWRSKPHLGLHINCLRYPGTDGLAEEDLAHLSVAEGLERNIKQEINQLVVEQRYSRFKPMRHRHLIFQD